MIESHIVVRNLYKTYRVPEREAGVGAALKSLVHRVYRDVEAVRDVSFEIARGEFVGFIGPNGAGKTTTLKVLSGLLHPTSGEVRVLGFTPWERRHDYLRRISMVLGNKSQMLWDIPPLDSFNVLGDIYHVPPAEFKSTLDELVALLDMEELLTKPVRTFSGRADEVRAGRRAAPPPGRALPRRADVGPGRLDAGAAETLFRGVQPAQRRDRHPHQPLHGRRCLLYTSPSPRDRTRSRMPSSA